MKIRGLYTSPKLTLAAVLLACSFAAIGLAGLSVTADLKVFFSDDNPELAAFREQEALFYQGDGVVFNIGGDILSRQGVEAVTWLSEQANTLPYVQRVESLSNYQFARQQDGEIYVDALFVDWQEMDDAEFLRAAGWARADNMIRNRLISADGSAAFIQASIELPGDNIQVETPLVVNTAHEFAEQFRQKFSDFELLVTGMTPFNQQLSVATLNDLMILLPICFVISLLLMGLMLRGVVPVVITTAVICASVLFAMGIAGWFGLVLNTATAAAPVIVMTLAIAHSVHLLESFRVAREHYPDDTLAALDRAMQVNLQPVSLTCLTTMVGFLCMNFSDAPPFRELGNIVAVGVAASGLFAYTLLPALVQVLPVPVGKHSADESRRMVRFGEWVVRHNRLLLIASLLVSLPLLFLASRNVINDEFRTWYPKSNEVRAGMDFALEKVGGAQYIHYTLDSGQRNGVTQAEFFRQAEALANWLRGHDHVSNVLIYTDILKRMNRVLRQDLPEQDVLPENDAQGRQFLTIYELSLPKDHSLNNLIDLNKQRTRMTVTLPSTTSSQILALDADVLKWVAENAPAISTEGGSGTPKMFAELGQRNSRSMVRGSIFALVLISGLMLVALRSWKIGLVSLVPNLLPVGLGFGIWFMLSGQIHIALSVVMGMTLGIIVDDSVHFLSKYLRARREQHLPVELAIPAAFGSVGRALMVTTVVLVAGFMVLAASGFVPTRDMGVLTAITIAVALIADFILLPALLLLIDRDSTHDIKLRGDEAEQLLDPAEMIEQIS